MKVFVTSYLESFSNNQVDRDEKWNWTPANSDVKKIYASGANTSTQQSTYAAEKDDRSDSDRPNEGMYVA